MLSLSARAFVSSLKGNVNRGATWEEIGRGLEKEGGNPVTIFYPLHGDAKSPGALSSSERSTLAKSCNWESIIIEPHGETHTFHFYMPSGEEVSFCGHAAIGASAFVANKYTLMNNIDCFLSAQVDTTNFLVSFGTAGNSRHDSIVRGNEVELVMNVHHEESNCKQLQNAPSLDEILSELGLDTSDLLIEHNMPTYINSSVARPKTLIPIKSVDRLHAAIPPKDPNKFCNLCDTINSTGIYLYSKCQSETNNAYESRQFPRASGYSEDPATGIAAGALASSLYSRDIRGDCYSINQGTAMGRPSNITVKIENYHTKNNVKLSYTGLVMFDSISVQCRN
jgi:PhzF family phenazine biosynthesis protein